jgi:hypothetical protein
MIQTGFHLSPAIRIERKSIKKREHFVEIYFAPARSRGQKREANRAHIGLVLKKPGGAWRRRLLVGKEGESECGKKYMSPSCFAPALWLPPSWRK